MTTEIGLFFDYSEYYDKEEGFYPQISIPTTSKQFSKIFIKFALRDGRFLQHSGPAISGFYDNHGENILNVLNAHFGSNCSVIVNFGGRIVHPTFFETTTFKIIARRRCFSF